MTLMFPAGHLWTPYRFACYSAADSLYPAVRAVETKTLIGFVFTLNQSENIFTLPHCIFKLHQGLLASEPTSLFLEELEVS